MKKKDIIKVKSFSENVSYGIEEYAKDEGINLESTTIFKEKKGHLPDSVFVFQHFANAFSKVDLSSTVHRVFWYLISCQGYENFVSIDVRTISENLGISIKSVSRAMAELNQLNIVLKTPYKHDLRRFEYFINPYSTWKGKTIKRDKFLKKEEKINKNQFSLEF